jgi:hypothetical protein
MCMPVMPRSSRPVHLYEAASIRGLHDIRSALHVLSQADRRNILDRPSAGALTVDALERYVEDAFSGFLMLARAYKKLREDVQMWRSSDNEEGSKEYVI